MKKNSALKRRYWCKNQHRGLQLACEALMMRFTDTWLAMTEKWGIGWTWTTPILPTKTNTSNTLWWLLKQLYDQGLLYKGYTIQPYSPAALQG
ncbi:MAG: class I tRNA ligase family protein [Spirosomataceae bacterium]